MKTNDILELDYRKEENKQIIQKALLNIKPLSKFSDESGKPIPLESLEKLLHMICKKYKVWVRYISQDPKASDDGDIWRSELVDESNLRSMKMVYGICLYELIAKIVIFLWSENKKEKLKRR